MKKTSFLAVIAVLFSALFALALGTSCDTGGGGGGGGSSGGGNSSSQNSSTSVTVTIPKSASSSSDINLLGEFTVADTAGFSYGVWFESTDGKTKVDEQFASEGGTITFSNVKYAKYNFYLKIYVDGRHKAVLDTLSIMNKEISEQDHTVNFPDMSTATYSNWFFVSTAAELSAKVAQINSDSTYSESNKAKICLLKDIEYAGAAELRVNPKVELVLNDFSCATKLFEVKFITNDGTLSGFDETKSYEANFVLTLPTKDYITKDGYLFCGWYEAEDFSGSKVTEITVDAEKTFYARWADGIYVKTGGTSSNDGLSEGKPVDNIATAMSKIEGLVTELGVSSFEWKIYVCGMITGANTLSSSSLTDGKILVVGKDSGTINGNAVGSALIIDIAVPVTIKDIKLTGGNATNGGGINIASGAKVSLVDTVVDSNSATANGGGIYSEGTLYISGSTMIGKDASSIAINSSYGNKANMAGAGIYSKGSLYLGFDASGEKSELTGGVCCNYLANLEVATAFGGGIYNDGGTVYFDTGKVSYNYAVSGAGISTTGNVTMTGGTIEGNEGNGTSGSGAGVYVKNGKIFTMSGNAAIKGNKNVSNGGGVFLGYDNCRLVMNGGTISGNSAESNGGAVYIHDLNASNYSILKMSGAAYIPFGGAEKKNDVFILDVHSSVEIAGDLTSEEVPVATITPNRYVEDRPILTGSSYFDGNLSKFAVTPQVVGTTTKSWFISSDGKITSTFPVENLTTSNYASYTELSVSTAAGMDVISTLASGGKDFSGKTITLKDNITLNTSYAPITKFCGVFDGNGKTISGLSGQAALFTYVNGSNAEVKNLSVAGNTTRAGIAVEVNNAKINGCTSSVTVNATETWSGGIVGDLREGEVTNCVNTGTITSTKGYFGGIVGATSKSGGVIDGCVNKGSVTSPNSTAGGIIGNSFIVVRNCINTGNISGGGGIVGNAHCPSDEEKGIVNCANFGTVSGSSYVGGIAGNCDISGTLGYNSLVKNCYNAGSVTATSGTPGGVVGGIQTGGSGQAYIEHNYYLSSTASIGIGGETENTTKTSSVSVGATEMTNWVVANVTDDTCKSWTTKDGKLVPDLDIEW